MREAVERRAEPLPEPAGTGGLTPLQRLIAPGDHERIVRLFGAVAADGPDASPVDPEADLDWPAAIQLIREAGGRIRQERAGAQEATRRAHALVGRSAEEAEAAEQRARAAEAAAEAALRRAEQAEMARAAAEAAAAAAEARAQRADEEATAARNAEAEARLWLRRLFACLKTEFAEPAIPCDGQV